jgi:hypothetical protein
MASFTLEINLQKGVKISDDLTTNVQTVNFVRICKSVQSVFNYRQILAVVSSN